MSLSEMEKKANKLIEQEETGPAVKQLYELVVAYAMAKDFAKANFWRDKIMDIDPMALREIVDSGEVIETEKASAIDDDHKDIWKDLYESITLEEANAFYTRLRQREFPSGKIIIQQGKLNNFLFFIDSGQLKTIFSQGGKDVFLNELEKGESAGQDTFFKITNCTTTVVTMGPVKLQILERSALSEIENDYPGFTTKLEDYCSRLDSKGTKKLLKNKALERRELQRHKLAGKITTQVFDKKGNPDGPTYYGWLDDISVGGASFYIQCSNKDVGRSLLGKPTTLTVRFEKGPQEKFNGLILGARFDLFNLYTIHLRFSKPFDKSKLKDIASICPPSTAHPPKMT
ncbi:MAG: cyclic nucleotide-binding domain-containing protein [Nitrospinales bacterium]